MLRKKIFKNDIISFRINTYNFKRGNIIREEMNTRRRFD